MRLAELPGSAPAAHAARIPHRVFVQMFCPYCGHLHVGPHLCRAGRFEVLRQPEDVPA